MAKTEKKDHIDVPVADLRARIDGKTRFSKSLLGYRSKQVNEYIAELAQSADGEREDYQSTVLGLQRNLREINDEAANLRQSITALETEQKNSVEREQRQLAEMAVLAKSVGEKNDLLQDAEQKLANWRNTDTSEENQRLQTELLSLHEENTKLQAQADMNVCELNSFKQLVADLQQKNLKLEQEIEGYSQRLLQLKLDRQRGISSVKTLQSTSVAALFNQLEGCMNFLNSFNEKAIAEIDIMTGE